MGHVIDLRSDTLTKPTDEMRRAMTSAEVGDDVYGEDPTVARLEERVAGMLGHEAALFTPTGSMANVLAVRSLVGPGQEVLCEASAHIARAELGAHGAYTGLTMRTWIHPRGQVDLDAIRTIFAPDMGPFFVPTAAISVENTHNFAGGAVLPLPDLRDLREYATGVGVGVHVDGARIWNAQTMEPLTPPLRHCRPVFGGSFLPNSRGIITTSRGQTWLWRFPNVAATANEMLNLAQLLSEGTASEGRSFEDNWLLFRDKCFNAPDTHQIASWHEFQAQDCEREQDWLAALFHLRRLQNLDPADTAVPGRIARAEQHLAR